VVQTDDAQRRSRDDAVAWGIVSHGEPCWPALLAVLAVLALQLILPDSLIRGLGNRGLIPALEGALIVVLLIANPGRISKEQSRLLLSSSSGPGPGADERLISCGTLASKGSHSTVGLCAVASALSECCQAAGPLALCAQFNSTPEGNGPISLEARATRWRDAGDAWNEGRDTSMVTIGKRPSGDERNDRWRGRPILSAAVSATVFVVPVALLRFIASANPSAAVTPTASMRNPPLLAQRSQAS
jgi:hypothetical protein